MGKKKSTYRTLAEALTFEKLPEMKVNLDHLDTRKLSVNEIKQCINEAFKDAKDAAEVDAQELVKGWGDSEIENEIEWAKALKLKEFFDPSAVTEEFDTDVITDKDSGSSDDSEEE